MTEVATPRGFVVLLRILLAWVFLYAASHQAFEPGWSAAGFLANTKTFNFLFAPLASPGLAPVISFLVAWGHLLIGLSLLAGLALRVSAAFGALLMILYWMAHMDFPFITNTNNFIVDDHIIYGVVLVMLIVVKAGHVWGLDTWASKQDFAKGGIVGWAVN